VGHQHQDQATTWIVTATRAHRDHVVDAEALAGVVDGALVKTRAHQWCWQFSKTARFEESESVHAAPEMQRVVVR
jgi:hypothetical protein